MKKALLYLTFSAHLFLLTYNCAVAQNNRNYRAYTSTEYNRDLLAADETFASALSAFERNARESYYDASAEVVTIPIVFHVLYTSPLDIIDEGQILSQFEGLNRDFSLTELPREDERDPGGSFRKLAADTKIRFCRPAFDPSGDATDGIEFRLIPFNIVDDLVALKDDLLGLAPWDGKRYLNIWVSPLPEGVGGFAQLPGGPLGLDGIVIDPAYLGGGGMAREPYDQGKTLTHLVGTYLGLKELWAGEGCEDDGVADTPIHNAPNVGRPGPGHTSTCDGYPAEMSMNFMDNTNDEATYMFTKGQVIRMRAALAEGGPRAQLASTETQCSVTEDLDFSPQTDPVLKVELSKEDIELRLTPNPSPGIFQANITLAEEAGDGIITVIDISGRIMEERSLDGYQGFQTITIDGGNWPAGLYFIKLAQSEKAIVRRLTIQ